MRLEFVAGMGVALLASVSLADSVDVGFTRISSNADENVEAQFNLRIETVVGDTSVVDFTFTNDVGIASSISEIYIDNGSPTGEVLDSGSIFAQSGTDFEWGTANPGDLPGGNGLGDPFDVTPGLLGDAQGNPSKGIDAFGELLTIRIAFQGGKSFADILDGLMDGSLRVGLHVRSIGADEESDGFINEPPLIVPMPTTAALASLGLLGMGVRRRR